MGKKYILKFIIIIGVITFLYILGLNFLNQNNDSSINNSDNILNFDYKASADENVLYFLNGDDIDTIVMGGPYYMGNNRLNGGGLEEYEILRETKINESISLSEDLYKNSVNLNTQLDNYKGYLVNLWGILIEQDKELEKEKNFISEYLIESKLKIDGLNNYYNSIETKDTNEAVKAGMLYRKSIASIKYGQLVTDDFNKFVALATSIYDKYEASENQVINDALLEFDKLMAGVDELYIYSEETQTSLYSLYITFQQLQEAEENIGMGAIISIEANIGKVKNEISKINISDDISQEDINFFNQYADFFTEYVDGYKQMYKENQLSNYKDKNMVISYANAGFKDYYNSAVSSLKKTAKSAVQSGASAIEKGLSRTGVKKKYQKAKKALGIGVGLLNAGVKSSFDAYFTWENKQAFDNEAKYAKGKGAMKNLGESIMDNFKNFDTNLKNNVAGSEVYDTAGDYLAGIDEFGQKVAEGGVEKVMGAGYTSKVAGWLGKTAGNLFTGFGQGVYKLANPKSSKGEIAEGILDIGLSFIGGSKSIAKGSKLMVGAKNSSKTVLKSGLNFIGKMPSGGKSFIKNGLKQTISEGIETSMKSITTKLTSGFNDMMLAGWKQLGENAPKAIKSSYGDFVKTSFKNSLGGYIKAVKSTIGGNPIDFFDNAFGNEVDGWMKGLIKEAINETIVEDDSEEEDIDDENQEEEDSFIGDVAFIFYRDLPPGLDAGTADPQALLQYELFKSMNTPIIVGEDNDEFEISGELKNISVDGGNHKIKGADVSIKGNGFYDPDEGTISGNFVYKWLGTSWNGQLKGGYSKKLEYITYTCSFSQKLPDDKDSIRLKTSGEIVSIKDYQTDDEWVVEGKGCISPYIKVEWFDD